MSFVPENDLERSLIKASADPAHRPQFYKDFSQAKIYVVQHGTRIPSHHERLTMEVGTDIELEHVEYDGNSYIPIFSSLTRLEATLSAEAAYLGMNALEFMELTNGAPCLLNPGSDYGKEFTAEEIASIRDGSIWNPSERHTAQAGTEILIGVPAVYPTELVDTLSRFFKTKRQVKRAWCAHFYNPDDGQKPHTIIGIEAGEAYDEVAAEAGLIVNSIPIPDPPVDIMPIRGLGGVEDYFLKDSKPFYTRRLFGIF